MVGKNLSEPLFLTVLFSRLSFLSRRGAGKNNTGRTTLWGRHQTRQLQPWWVSSPLGVARVWNATTQVGLQGLTWRAPHGGTHPWVCTTDKALPPGSPSGWSTLLKWIPVGTQVSATGWAARSPGSAAKVLRHRGGLVQLQFPSRVVVWLSSTLRATLGVSPIVRPTSKKLFTAGAAWKKGKRPHVRGVAINPVDHPHGGGQGKTSGGRPGVTPWGRLTRGVPTRRKQPSRS